MKTCSGCKTPKKESEFHKDHRSPDGLKYTCKPCVSIKDAALGNDGLTCNQRIQAKIGPDGLTNYQRKKINEPGFWKKTGIDGRTNAQRWEFKNPEKVRAHRLKQYGITPGDFERMLAEQGGACAICKDINRKWCVDHDHSSGEVRAILCHGCNTAIGNLGDSSELATAAVNYLLKHGK